MAIATPSHSNDAALNANLNITRDASIANLEQKSEEVRQQYRDEAARITAQKERSAELVQSSVNAALDNTAVRSAAEYDQAFKNLQTAQDLAMRTSAANPRNTKLPLEVHRQIVNATQEFLTAQADYVSTHPDKANDPAYNIQLAEDGNGGFQLVNGLDPGLAEQVAITSPDEAQTMPLDELRRNVQRPQQRQVNPNEPLVTFIDQPDGKVTMKLATGETFPDLPNQNRDALRKLGESKVNTRRWAEEKILAVQQQQPANSQQQTQPQPQTQSQNNPIVDGNQSLTDWFLDETSKRFGYQNGAEMVADQNARYQREQQNNALLEQYKNEHTVQDFFAAHPEYPNTDQANAALEQIINRNGWEWNADTMAAAHALAVQTRVYQPLTQEEIAVSNGYAPPAHRRAPPPMVNSNNPDTNAPAVDLWSEPLDQQRKRILAAQRAELQGGR